MGRLTAKNIRLLRYVMLLVGIIATFALWLFIPSFIENNRLTHVGNGKYGSKLGFLLIVTLPLLGLIPRKGSLWENLGGIHTEDPEEKAKIEDEYEIEEERRKLVCTVACDIAACFIMILVIVLG